MGARKIEVIETTLTRRGDGTPENPVRCVTQYWDVDGRLLAEVDPVVYDLQQGAGTAEGKR